MNDAEARRATHDKLAWEQKAAWEAAQKDTKSKDAGGGSAGTGKGDRGVKEEARPTGPSSRCRSRQSHSTSPADTSRMDRSVESTSKSANYNNNHNNSYEDIAKPEKIQK